jgi:hypothetical protein
MFIIRSKKFRSIYCTDGSWYSKSKPLEFETEKAARAYQEETFVTIRDGGRLMTREELDDSMVIEQQ